VITLAIEQSSDNGSVALLDDDVLLGEQGWRYARFENQTLFTALRRVLEDSALGIQAVEAIAVGLGPGSFTGIRIAVSAAQALALPSNLQLLGLSSGEALAYDVFREADADQVVIMGDARRQCAWFAHFENRNGWPMMVQPWSLQPLKDIAAVIPDNAVVTGPDWERIGEQLRNACPANCNLIEGPRVPLASSVGCLAVHQMSVGDVPAPLEPLYLHPPVSAKPGS
jgi:tRNA threonylcarbamoyladenosine biosynthesis protein TsaB